jgi:hypothetical protein
LPSLTDCRGAFNLQSFNDISADCATFHAEQGANSVIKGKYQCAGNQTNPGNAGSTPSGTSSGAGSSSTKKGDAHHLDISTNAVIGIGSVLAAMLGMF